MLAERHQRKIYKICLTGGPCAGKTTALSHLSSVFSKSYSVLTIPEICTLTFESGFETIPSRDEHLNRVEFNKIISQCQIDLEKYYEGLAAMMQKPVLLLIDRGVVDNFAYSGPQIKQEILEDTKWSMGDIRNERYDLVVHMVTAALGATQYYGSENNQARTETSQEAVVVDKGVLDEWLGHPNLVVVDNTIEGFDSKLRRVEDSIRNIVEGPMLRTKYKKIKISKTTGPENFPPSTYIECFSELSSKKQDGSVYVQRTYDDSGLKSYYCVLRVDIEDGDGIYESRKLIDEEEYARSAKSCSGFFEKNIVAFGIRNEETIALLFIETFSLNNEYMSVLRINTDIDSHGGYASVPFLSLEGEFEHHNDKSYIEY